MSHEDGGSNNLYGGRNGGVSGARKPGMRSEGYPSLDGADDLARRVEESLRNVDEDAFHMNRAIGVQNVDDAIRHAVKMLRELRSVALSPRTYYELWMKIFDKLRTLHAFFLELKASGTIIMSDLYRKVQETTHIIPRLYLMITVGSAMVECRECPTKDVLQDLIEMSKGVQHPMRGLFLRNYLLKMTQDKLSAQYNDATEGGSGFGDFCVGYILQNFGEMNRLWVRMQHQGTAQNKARREKERQDLKILISYNLVRLSEFEGMTLNLYKTTGLDKVMDLIQNCKDRIAQQYLLDVLVQVFPASFHLETMPKLFESFAHLEEGVELKSILISLMERLKQYSEEAEDDEGGSDDRTEAGDGDGDLATADGAEETMCKIKPKVSPEAFTHLDEVISGIIAKRKNMAVEDVLDLQVAFLEFSLVCFPGQLEYIDRILGFCATYLADTLKQQQAEGANNVVDILIVQLLKAGLRQQQLNSIDLLELEHFPNLMAHLSWNSKKKVAHSFLLHALGDPNFVLESTSTVTKLLGFIAPLIMDDEIRAGTANGEGENMEDPVSASALPGFEEQQQSVAKLVHHMNSADDTTQLKILSLARKHFGKGGVNRIRYTFVSLCFCFFQLADRVVAATKAEIVKPDSNKGDDEEEEDVLGSMNDGGDGGNRGASLRKIFQYLHEIISTLAGVTALQEIALRMFLQAGQCADRCREQEVAYEFMVQAFTIYEDVADTKEQLRLLPVLIGTLQGLTVFDKDGYDTFVTKTTQYSVRLLKKTDQCKMVVLCAHLLWATTPERELDEGEEQPAPGKDAKRALDCLKRSLKIANGCVTSSLHNSLLVNILNHYVYFFQAGMETVTAKNINDLVAIIKRNLSDEDVSAEDRADFEPYFNETLAHIKRLVAGNPGNEKYSALADVL